MRQKSSIPELLSDYFRSFLAGIDVELVDPTPEAIMLAVELKFKGHPDIFDCIAYATAKFEEALFLTVDEDSVKFLERNGYDLEFVIDERQFLKIARPGYKQ